MKKKSLFISILFVFALLLLSACGSSSSGGEEQSSESNNNENNGKSSEEVIELKLASAIPATNAFSKNMEQYFIDRVAELTDGQVKIEHYPGEQLGKAGDLLKLTKDGAVDIGYVATPYYESELQISNSLLGMPGLYKDGLEGTLAYQAILHQEPVLEKDFLSNGIRPLAAATTTPYEFFTAGKEIKNPEDLKGARVRSPGGVSNYLFDELGAVVVSVTTAEMFEAFDRGLVDTLYMFPRSLNDAGLGELVEYGTQGLGLGGSGMILAINEKKWQSLPENVQEAMLTAGKEAGENYARLDLEQGKKVLEEWEAAGKNIVDLSETESAAKWKEFIDKFNENWIKEKNNPDFEKAFEMFQQEVEKVRSGN